MLLLYILGVIIVLLPIPFAFLAGPRPRIERIAYMVVGLLFATLVGLILFTISVQNQFENPNSFLARIVRFSFAGLLEELVRFPAILFAQRLGVKITSNKSNPIKDTSEISSVNHSDKGLWTEITDPHGIGIYFGVGWGLAETFAFYIYPAYLDYRGGTPWIWTTHLFLILVRLTAIMAHTALTYLSMIITVNRAFYRLTIGLHIGVNAFNVIFGQIAPLETTDNLVGIFTRFSLVLIAFYLLKPKARYMSPALLFFYQVMMFLVFIIIGTFLFLISWILRQFTILEVFR